MVTVFNITAELCIRVISCFHVFAFFLYYCNARKTGLQPVSRPMELFFYFGGGVEGASKQTDRTDSGWVQSTFGAKAGQIKLARRCRNVE